MRAVAVGLGVVMLAGCVVRPLKPYRVKGVVYYGQESVTQPAAQTAQAMNEADTGDQPVAVATTAAHPF
jgi:hypothetical protein